MICEKSLFERDEGRIDFVITQTMRHWSGPTEAPANAAKCAMLVIAPLLGRIEVDEELASSAVALLARRGYRIGELEHATSVCLIGEVLTPEIRELLALCHAKGLILINWSLVGTVLERYARTLWNKRPDV